MHEESNVSTNSLLALATVLSALSALIAVGIGWISLRETRRAEALRRGLASHEQDASFSARLDVLYPDLRRILGHPNDGVPQQIRGPLISFFVLYADAYAARRDGLLDDRDWASIGEELAYWAQRPTARRAWRAFKQQSWATGFTDYIDAMLDGPVVYPEICDDQHIPEVDWPETSDSDNAHKPI
jgi:hypothetical protein